MTRSFTIAALGLTLFLHGCTSTSIAVCPPLKSYPPEFNARLADEVEAMPADAASLQAIQDYMATRDAIRACLDAS